MPSEWVICILEQFRNILQTLGQLVDIDDHKECQTCSGGAVSFMRRGDSDVNFGQSGPGDLKDICKIDDISSCICVGICICKIDDKDKLMEY